MSGRLYCGFFHPTRLSHYATSYPLTNRGSHCVALTKANAIANKNIASMQKLSFEEFKEKKLRTFEEFKNSPEIKKLYKDNEETIKRVYEDYCICKYNRYKISQYGGNPGTMI